MLTLPFRSRKKTADAIALVREETAGARGRWPPIEVAQCSTVGRQEVSRFPSKPGDQPQAARLSGGVKRGEYRVLSSKWCGASRGCLGAFGTLQLAWRSLTGPDGTGHGETLRARSSRHIPIC